jgi:hypothetical protein
MQKIMFNDKYGLTDAVLAKRKTQTRRIITNKEMLEIIKKFDYPSSFFLFYDRFFLNPDLRKRFLNNRRVMRYQENETVAIAQSYKDIHAEILREIGDLELKKEFLQSKGYTNKMFVRAEKMPHSIRITNIRIERLQDISEEDCLKEGIWHDDNVWLEGVTYCYRCLTNGSYRTAREAYASLINRISGKGTWESNPYVFVYDFELIE